MKKAFIVLMVLLTAFSLAGCSSKGEEAGDVKQETDGKARIGDTDFLVPDEVMDVRSVNTEIEEDPEEENCDLKVTFSYEAPEKAMEAFVLYTEEYLGTQFPDRMDSKGYLIRVSNPDVKGSDQFVIRIRKGVIVNDELIQKYAGKYLLTGYEDDEEMTEFLKKQWEDRSYYTYMEIKEDGTGIIRMIENAKIKSERTFTLQEVLNSNMITEEENGIKMQSGKTVLLFERNNEIPADPE